jgi:hypothetical protein
MLICDASLLSMFRIIVPKWTMVRAEDRERVIPKSLPDRLLALLIARWWGAYEFRAFEPWFVEVVSS